MRSVGSRVGRRFNHAYYKYTDIINLICFLFLLSWIHVCRVNAVTGVKVKEPSYILQSWKKGKYSTPSKIANFIVTIKIQQVNGTGNQS